MPSRRGLSLPRFFTAPLAWLLVATFIGCDLERAPGESTTPSTAALLPTTAGWYEVPNSKLRAVCPPANFGGTSYDFSFYCQGITEAWGSGVMDTSRNRLIVWGGGHNNYYGNEVYAFNVDALTVERLNDPGLPLWPMDGSYGGTTIANGTQPNSRHTYDGLTYMPNVDKMFVVGGAVAGQNGALTSDTWMLSFGDLSWEKAFESAPFRVSIAATGYDPRTSRVMVHSVNDRGYLHAYDPVTKQYQQLSDTEIQLDYHMTGVVDPVKNRFVISGGGQFVVFDIGPGSAFEPQRPTTTGGDTIVNGNYPGLVFDPVSERIVAWNGGDTVYSLDLDSYIWTPITFPNGPGPATNTGTNKRWSYSPASGVFVLINSMNQNAFTLRLNAGGPAAPRNLRVAP